MLVALIERYTLPEMGELWNDLYKYKTWLQVEIAVCEAQADLGYIPAEAVEEIKAKADFNPERIADIEAEVRHDVIAFLTSVNEYVGAAGRYIHLGMTSSDMLDTALSVQLVESLKAQGKAILFISHKFDEIFRIADRYTVFRDGQFVGAGAVSDVSEAQLVKMMVGRDVSQIFPKRDTVTGDTVLEVEGYSHPTEFADIGFSLKRGEILGFYGLVGAGRSEFMQALFGITKPDSGQVRIDGKAGSIKSPADAVSNGIVYVPEDRGRQGAIAALPIFQNVSLPSLGRTSRNGFLRMAEEFKLARTYAERLDLRAASLDTPVGNLSGGNQQKVVIAKWLATQPKVIILDEPTKGIDIGSKAAVHEFMAELAAQGLAVIMVSSEIPEILGMSDRAIVMREGRMVAELQGDRLTPETLVRHAAGIEAGQC